jgi:RNA polymerase primary sigma factor
MAAIDTLPVRDARIVRMRFGIGHDRSYTLEEVGQTFGVTRERIRQIEYKVMKRLQHDPDLRKIFLDLTGRRRMGHL